MLEDLWKEREEGLTQVTGIVLLIVITIASVGVIYALTQGLLGQNEGLTSQQVASTKLVPGSAVSENGEIVLSVMNTGERTVKVSDFKLLIQENEGGSPVSYKQYAELHPEKVDKEVSYRFEQNERKFFIDPYNDTETGKEWYPDTNQLGTADSPLVNALSSFAILLYYDRTTGTEYLVFNNQNSNETDPPGQSGSTEIDLWNIPSGTTVNYSDGGAGEGPGARSDAPELTLGAEPEGDWGWITGPNCCYDGGVLTMPEDWENISIRQLDTNMEKLQLYEKGNGSIEIEKFEPITLRRIVGNQCFDADYENQSLEPGESYRCSTGVKMPEIEKFFLVVEFKGYNKDWVYECDPTAGGSVC